MTIVSVACLGGAIAFAATRPRSRNAAAPPVAVPTSEPSRFGSGNTQVAVDPSTNGTATAVAEASTTTSLRATTSAAATSTTSPPASAATTLVNTLLAAEVQHNWKTARMFDALSSRTDASLDAGYAGLHDQEMYLAGAPAPVAPGVWRVRFTLVAHNTKSGSATTASYCELWDVDVAAGTIHAVVDGQPLTRTDAPGWVDPPAVPECS